MKIKNYKIYLWLVNTIYSTGKITLKDLQQKWFGTSFYKEGQGRLERRRLYRLRCDILDLFGIVIECNRHSNTYYIANRHKIQEDGLRKWILNSFAVNAMLHDSEELRPRILFEDIPSGHNFLLPILNAMRNNNELKMSYQGYHRSRPHTFVVAPYCLKVFRQRWYLVGQSDVHDELRTYALDRIVSLRLTDRKFVLPFDFEADKYFDGYFGVICDSKFKAETIRIKVDSMTAKYFNSLPLHDSQCEVEQTDKYSVFLYHVAPTYDFIQELRTQGANLEILAPLWLREEFKKEAIRMLEKYM